MTQGRGRWLTHEIVTTDPVTGRSRHLTNLSCYGPPVGGRGIAELTPMGLFFVFKSACVFVMLGIKVWRWFMFKILFLPCVKKTSEWGH